MASSCVVGTGADASVSAPLLPEVSDGQGAEERPRIPRPGPKADGGNGGPVWIDTVGGII